MQTISTPHPGPTTIRPDAHASLAAATRLTDDLGVVSVYVDEHGATSGRGAIGHLLDEPPPDGAAELERTVAALERRLAASPARRPRALFAGAASQQTLEVPLPVPVEPYAAFDQLAHVRPLLRALERARPAGLVVLNAANLELLEIAGTALTRLRAVDVAAAQDEWVERRGAPARRPRSWGDGHARLRRHRVDRLAARFADHVTTVARLRGWDVVVATGSRRLMAAFARRFAGRQPELVELQPSVSRRSRRSLAAQASDAVLSFRRARTLTMAGHIVESPATIWGVEPVLDALEAGRVQHLLVADDLPADSAERLIGRALATGAQLTMLDAGALGPLGAAGGPRW